MVKKLFKKAEDSILFLSVDILILVTLIPIIPLLITNSPNISATERTILSLTTLDMAG